MDRHRAQERFWTVSAIALVLGLLARWLDPPRALTIALAAVSGGASAHYGAHWLRGAIRDGSLRRALPDYGWAFVGLLVIAGACGLVTLAGLLIAREPVEAIDVSSGAAAGTLLVLGAWWLRGAVAAIRRRRDARHRVAL